jgi:hypothetical protein
MKEPVHHIVRAKLPWRDEPDLTECGHLASEMALVWTRDEAVAQFKELGQQRMAMLTCMTCMDTANRWPRWDNSPVAVMQRECQREGWHHRAYARIYPPEAAEKDILERELRALAALVAAHQEEFREMVDGLAETGDLASKRAARAAKARRETYR